MTPQDFIQKWGAPDGVPGPAYHLNEEQGAQSHFLDLCDLLGVPKPGSSEGYRFEEKSAIIGGHVGYADVFLPGVFAWENKAPGKNLDSALKQLLSYSLALSNPPLLVVSDRLTIRIHTQFTGHPSETHEVRLEQLDQPDKLSLLRRIWNAPESFKPKITNRDITEAAAKSFANLAEGLRRRGDATQQRANQVAHFLTQCLFCFFAEDVGLLPGRMFERMVTNRKITADKLTLGLFDLFSAMGSGGMFGADEIPWFNGGLFKTIDVPTLSILDVTELRSAAELNWSAIDVSIFGTLFERGLDPAKRSQLGAHYTDTATIDRLIEPVLRRPLLEKWKLVAQEISALQAKSTKKGSKSYRDAKARFIKWLDYLKNFRVLDPACGSGNFLFLGLKALKDIEHRSHLEAAALGLDREADLVTGPHNVLGIELNEYAAELARVTVWIGELQWRMAHGYEFKTNPVLEPLDHIECRDALIAWDSEARAGRTPGAHTLRFLKSPPTSAPPTPRSDTQAGPAQAVEATEETEATQENGVRSEFMRDASPKTATLVRNSALTPVSGAAGAMQAVEAQWPKANVVIGNPPFLGDKKMRSELGDAYTEVLRKTYEGRVPGGADLVCYWFEKARTAIESDGLEAAGLVATNSIRGGKNRAVLDAISKTTRIFEAWSDEGWVNEGAAVRVSLVAFGHATQVTRLDGSEVPKIHADLSSTANENFGADLTTARALLANTATAFVGIQKTGPFEISGDIARSWLRQPNPNSQPNSRVVRPWFNGLDVARRNRDMWIVDFGADMAKTEATLFEKPFDYVTEHVKPTRVGKREVRTNECYWLFQWSRPVMRVAIAGLPRFIVTPEVAKHRNFAWLPATTIADKNLSVVARADDSTFGILHSRFHELWSLRMGTSLEDRPRYTPTTCFETFPFPEGLTPADTAHQCTEIVEGGALIPGNWGQIPISPGTMSASGHAKLESDPKFPATVASQRSEAGVVRMSGPISKSEAYEAPASESAPPSAHPQVTRQQAIQIATTAKKLNDLREAWLNPQEWTHKVPEVLPLGMSQSPYPDRIAPKPGISEADLKALQKRTLTNLYNQRPAWLTMAHQQLDQAVAAAYGWTDYSAEMPDEEILKRLLALNLQRAAQMA